MNKWVIKGDWDDARQKLMQRYSQLTEEDLTFSYGEEDQLLGRLEKKIGKPVDQIRTEIEQL
jgi:uncharacterized protein YjbJ (UPF0337 family)